MARKGVLIGLLVAVLASTAWGFDAFFSDAAGNRLGRVQEGQRVYIAIRDHDKGAAGIDQFLADLVMFDWNTGVYHEASGACFRELGGIGTGLYFWVTDPGSATRVTVQIGSRADFTRVLGQTHVPGRITPARRWLEGAWDYVDENILDGDPATTTAFTEVDLNFEEFPRERQTARVSLEGFDASPLRTADGVAPQTVSGRFENNSTVVLIVADHADERNIDKDQIKIIDTVGVLGVDPIRIRYGCEPACDDIVVTIRDRDENLDCNEVEYVPFFVIVNPGGWTPPQTSEINNFCALMLRGSFDGNAVAPEADLDLGLPLVAQDLDQPIRWYNIYDEPVQATTRGNPWSRWILYPRDWLDEGNPFLVGGVAVGRVLFFAAETSVDSGEFVFNFGNIHELQAALGFRRFIPGTTIAFYYMDPNDPDDMTLVTIEVGDRPHSETFITDADGRPVDVVRIGTGWGGIYARVHDADANVEACCPDRVVVHICNPSNAGDSEFIVIDEISPNSGIFATMTGVALLPVWDAVAGYQLVFDDWTVQAMNEDTIFVRYNSVDYWQQFLNLLGDRNANQVVREEDHRIDFNVDGDTTDVFLGFPPRINPAAARNQPWDVSFDVVKAFDTQVFDGTTARMRFLDERFQPVPAGGIPLGGSLFLEVTDPDQNEHPTLRELVFGGWNKDAEAGEQGDATVARTTGLTPGTAVASQSAGEDSAPIWWVATGASDRMTPRGAFLGSTAGGTPSVDDSITAVPETVKVFMWNAQRGTWERMDLRETAVGSGIFRSTTCVLVADARNPGDGNLASRPGDTIMAFYQDPSNHADISIISIKVAEGGAAGITPPVVALDVAFDRATYIAGDTVTITVTDEQYAGAMEIAGVTPVLVLRDASGAVLSSWTTIPAVPGQPGRFRVSYVLPLNVKPGTITAVYTDPIIAARTAQATARVDAARLERVTALRPVPEVFSATTTFTAITEPVGAVADRITITIFDLTGRNVATLTGTNTATVTWNGGNLRDGAYIYVAVVRGAEQDWTFRGFVYIKR